MAGSVHLDIEDSTSQAQDICTAEAPPSHDTGRSREARVVTFDPAKALYGSEWQPCLGVVIGGRQSRGEAAL